MPPQCPHGARHTLALTGHSAHSTFNTANDTAGWVSPSLHHRRGNRFGEVQGLAPRGTAWRVSIQTEASLMQRAGHAPWEVFPTGPRVNPDSRGISRVRQRPLRSSFSESQLPKATSRFHLNLICMCLS